MLPQPQQPQSSAPGHALQINQNGSSKQQQRQEPPDMQERVMRTVYLPTSSADTLAMRVDALQAQLEEQVPVRHAVDVQVSWRCPKLLNTSKKHSACQSAAETSSAGPAMLRSAAFVLVFHSWLNIDMHRSGRRMSALGASKECTPGGSCPASPPALTRKWHWPSAFS